MASPPTNDPCSAGAGSERVMIAFRPGACVDCAGGATEQPCVKGARRPCRRRRQRHPAVQFSFHRTRICVTVQTL